MKKNIRRALIAVLSLSSAGAVFHLFANQAEKPLTSEAEQLAEHALVERVVTVQPETVDVLVAAGDLQVGSKLNSGSLSWQAWPKEFAPANAILRPDTPDAQDSLGNGTIMVRSAILAGEPVSMRKLVAGQSGFVAAMLQDGMRAYAIRIDQAGGTSAGGFILPDDRVDVVHTTAPDRSQQSSVKVRSSIILENIRVLAVGSALSDEAAQQPRVVGETATLEVSPEQALVLAEAAKTGDLSLVLRGVADDRAVSTMDRERVEIEVIRAGKRTDHAN